MIVDFIRIDNHLISEYHSKLAEFGVTTFITHLSISGKSDNSLEYKFDFDENLDQKEKLEYHDDDTKSEIIFSSNTRLFWIRNSKQKRLWICNQQKDSVTPVTIDNFASLTREPGYTFWIY